MLPKSFEQFKFVDFVNDSIVNLGFKKPTQVQEKVFSPILKGRNIIAKSETGSGKTHSFLLPIFSKIDADNSQLQTIILAPTRELSRQLFDMAGHIASFSKKSIKISLLIGGQDILRDVSKVKSNPQIIIGTPTRILELSKRGAINLKTVKYFVIDECDVMVDLGFIDDIDNIISKTGKNCSFSVFSATISKQISVFLKKHFKNSEFVEIKNPSPKNIKYYLVSEKGYTKIQRLSNIIDTINPYLAIIFANKKKEVEEITEYLSSRGIKVGSLHGDLSSRERKQVQKRINNLDFTYIVASDLMSRGIDIEAVSHIINYNIPNDLDFFVHRAGRTARGGMDGICITIYSEKDEDKLKHLEKSGIKFEHKDIKNGEFIEVKDRNKRQKRKKITPDHDLTKKLKSKVRTSKKVKPGYKKKHKYKMDKLKQKERRKFAKRQNKK